MHEHKIGRSIVEEAVKQGGGKLNKIVVECGSLAHLPASDMAFVLEGLVAEDVEVEVIEKPALVRCSDCSFEGEPSIELHSHDATVFFCPNCGSVPEVLDGLDIILKSIEVED